MLQSCLSAPVHPSVHPSVRPSFPLSFLFGSSSPSVDSLSPVGPFVLRRAHQVPYLHSCSPSSQPVYHRHSNPSILVLYTMTIFLFLSIGREHLLSWHLSLRPSPCPALTLSSFTVQFPASTRPSSLICPLHHQLLPLGCSASAAPSQLNPEPGSTAENCLRTVTHLSVLCSLDLESTTALFCFW